MLFRLLFLLSFLGYTTGPDLTDEVKEPGGKGFGSVVLLFAGLGLIVLIVLLVFAGLILSGHYDSQFLDPLT